MSWLLGGFVRVFSRLLMLFGVPREFWEASEFFAVSTSLQFSFLGETKVLNGSISGTENFGGI